ncbi:zinc ribbon domain-containing protein [Streptomyces mangrovi]|uniref:zinc ribbon domain-containing protein n=1 Tax=Streptomyces mangrovi TaxID=1206892 RepID=UPI00399C8986
MHVCPACGTSNGPGDDFCGNCGAYLGWSDTPPAPGTRSEQAAPPEPAPAPPPAEEEPGREEDTSPPPRTGPGRDRTGPPTPTPAPAPAPAPKTATPDPVVPVRPAKPVAPRPVVRPAAVPDEAAGTPCHACGTPNPPGRRFCRRCAAALNPAADPAPPPWWRTVWPPRRRARAGSGRAVRFLVTLAAVAAVCAGALLLLPAGRTVFEDARDKMSKPGPVTPVDIEASAELPRHPAVNTTDGVSNRYWGAPAPGASVTYTFREPFRLVDLIIINGASKSPEDYARQARALRLDLEVTEQDGTRHREELTLGDKPGPQTFPLGISDVKTVRLVLRSAVDLTADRHLALAEVEFFQRG